MARTKESEMAEPLPEGAQTLDILDKGFKITVLSMLKEVKKKWPKN